MILKDLKPRLALNKAFLKVKPNRPEIELFKDNLIRLLGKIDEIEREENQKNHILNFLRDTYYKDTNEINTKESIDLVIHNGKDAKSTVGVIIEAKRPGNKNEMISKNNLNAKAFQELVLYYLRERITKNNIEIKHLIATNIYEWFIFDAHIFEKHFAQNKALVKLFKDFEEGRLSGTKTDFFYKEIATPAINEITTEISFAYFNIKEYEKPLRNASKTDDNVLIALFKLLSPEHLLKQPFANDSNTLDKSFYSELLHIIGLTEIKEGSKKLIDRKAIGDRNPHSLIENTIDKLESLEKVTRYDNKRLSDDEYQKKLYDIALELSLTWINRILFLKLLEAQLKKYHKGDPEYTFMNIIKVKGFDDLSDLFFNVLAKLPEERNTKMKVSFPKVPYLNSSLFEQTELEKNYFTIGTLGNGELALYQSSVLKGIAQYNNLKTLTDLEYIFAFLDAYDFASEGSEEIQEDNKKLINASVLGLIFEKINGYKDGSFFTPGFITMYMCRETIRRAVLKKFNDVKRLNCKNFIELYNKHIDPKEANDIINSIKICDPAVGSGHFLVSALNEMIAIKSELELLVDTKGKVLFHYPVEVANDELIVTNKFDGTIFEYDPTNVESQRVQSALFQAKQEIIENSLFGVDINPKSVMICRLRLWIELLKNSYYKSGTNELETLPNIDINIKCGNSLISRFAIDDDIKPALKKSKWTIDSYRNAIMGYRNAKSKEEKRELERLIEIIKNDFETEVWRYDPRKLRKKKLDAQLSDKTAEHLFEMSENDKARWNKEIKKLTDEIQKLGTELAEIENNKIYENAFEWRFEFPEVLDDDGNFVGFDVVIGNPPYISSKEIKYKTQYRKFIVAKEQFDLYSLFMELSIIILKPNGINSLIVPDSFLARSSFTPIREFLFKNTDLFRIAQLDRVFPEANVSSSLYFTVKSENKGNSIEFIKTETYTTWIKEDTVTKNIYYLTDDKINSYRLLFINGEEFSLIKKIFEHEPINHFCELWRGEEIGKASNLIEIINSGNSVRILQGENISRYFLKGEKVYISKENIKKDIDRYSHEKLVIRQLGDNINATLSQEAEISLQSVYCLYSKRNEYENKYILAILNSKLINFLYQNLFAEKQTFPRILIENIKKINIPLPKNGKDKFLIDLVNQILAHKQSDPTAATGDLEQQIDKLVYELYGLTEEEIKIVEGA
jgi:hypothetical protein